MTRGDKAYSKARIFFKISASEIVAELKKLPITRTGNLNDWSATKIVEGAMVILHKHLRRF